MRFFCLPLENIIKLAVKCFSKTRQRSEENITILHEKLVKAILAKKWKKAEEFIQRGADINHTVNKYGEPILFLAKDVATIRKLLELGADLNARDYSGEGIVGHAILNSWNLDVIQELIKQGAYVGARNNLYISSLERAVAVGNHEKIKLLIENGACCRDERLSETPMNYCINNFEGAKTVIKHVMLKYFDQDYTEIIGLENYNYPYIFRNYEYLKEYFVKCEIELQRMKTVKISGSASLLDLLLSGDSNPYIMFQNTTEIELLLSCITENGMRTKRNRIFPIYQDLIINALKSAIQRQELLKQLELLDLSAVEGQKCISLDVSSKFIIFRYLPNEALRTLIKSYKKRKSFNTYLSKVRSMFKF